MKPFISTVAAVLFVGILSASPALAATIHVPADRPTIQAAINFASHEDLVLVAPGTYVENIDFLGKAINIRSEGGTDETVIDGNQAGPVVTFASSETEGTMIDGFTIRNGEAYDGGGIFCDESSPTITNCTITANSARSRGGGIYCYKSSPRITEATISENDANNAGGGIYCYSSHAMIESCTISHNSAEGSGGGIRSWHSSLSVIKCTIFQNTADYGGGIEMNDVSDDDSSPMISLCEISNNIAFGAGGGIACRERVSPNIRACTIRDNLCYGSGGGIYCSMASPPITNCTITRNSAGYGGGIKCHGSSSTILNCTISGNSADYGGGIWTGEASPTITNCILWGDTAPFGPEIYVDSYSPIVTYSDVQGGWPGIGVIGVIDEDPLFVGIDEYFLSEASPCIDAGDPDPSNNDICFPPSMGTERSDMGAYGGPRACEWWLWWSELWWLSWFDEDHDGYWDEAFGGATAMTGIRTSIRAPRRYATESTGTVAATPSTGTSTGTAP